MEPRYVTRKARGCAACGAYLVVPSWKTCQRCAKRDPYVRREMIAERERRAAYMAEWRKKRRA